MSKPEAPRSDDGQTGAASTLVLLARLTGVGWYVAASIGGGALGGLWLDGRFNSSPALMLTGLALGVTVAFAGMIKMLASMFRSGTSGHDG